MAKEMTVYLHSDKESMWAKGEEAGLSEEALDNFRYAAYEVKLTLSVDEKTGNAEIIAVDDRKLEAR